MQKNYPVCYKARVVIESISPLMLSTGQSDGVYDVTLLRDANGLPTLSGTAIAGVLRHLYDDVFALSNGNIATDRLFGYQDGNEGSGSLVSCSWGHVHDDKDIPVEGLKTFPNPSTVMALLLSDQPVLRDHVKLTHRGVAQDKAKFDRTAAPKGARFTFELSLYQAEENDELWNKLLALLSHPKFRLGGSTRAGYGCFTVQKLQTACFNLATEQGQNAFSQLPKSFSRPANSLNTTTPPTQYWEDVVLINLKLNAEDAWRVGQGSAFYSEKSKEKPADALVYSETVINWQNNQAQLQDKQWVVPGSSIKGAIAHRILFHWFRLTGQYAEDHLDEQGQLKTIEREGVVVDLLGDVKEERQEGNQNFGRTGQLFFKDCYLKPDAKRVGYRMHNSIDRFTGGTRDGALYSEEVIEGGTLDIELVLDLYNMKNKEANTGFTPEIKAALKAALDDLSEGRLGLGAGTGKGLGYFRGTQTWSNTDFIQAGAAS